MKPKELIQLIAAILMCVFGCGLLLTGMLIESVGVIDPTILVAFGEILTFASSLTGLDYHYRYKYSPPNCPSYLLQPVQGSPISPISSVLASALPIVPHLKRLGSLLL